MITCSVDIKNEDLIELWLYYCQTYKKRDRLDFPTGYGYELADLENEYKSLDLYYQFSKRLDMDYDEERLMKAKMNVARRTCGYIGENFWDVGKTKEIASRKLHI